MGPVRPGGSLRPWGLEVREMGKQGLRAPRPHPVPHASLPHPPPGRVPGSFDQAKGMCWGRGCPEVCAGAVG